MFLLEFCTLAQGFSMLLGEFYTLAQGLLYFQEVLNQVVQGLLCFQGWPDPCQCLSLRRGKTQWNSQGKIFPRDLGYKTFVRSNLMLCYNKLECFPLTNTYSLVKCLLRKWKILLLRLVLKRMPV
jgi:hypothetical protein